MKNNIPSEQKAFFATMAIMIPATWLLFGINKFVGVIIAWMLIGVVAAVKKEDWQTLGDLLDTRLLTLSVIVGGSLIVIAQYANSI